MASREAAVRVTLKTGSYQSGLRKMETETAASGRRMGTQLGSGLRAGLGAAKTALGGMLSQFKGMLKSAATLGGAFAVGSMVKTAIELQGKFRNLAFQITKTGKATMTWRDVQSAAQVAAAKTGRSTEEMADALGRVYAATGDLEFSKRALEVVGTTATATGKSTEALADVAQMLQRKFGITAEQLPEAMARFIEKTDAGGKSLDEMGAKFGLMAGEAADAGFKGEEGVSQLLGVMEKLDSRVGERAEPGLKRLFQTLKKGSSDLKSLEKASGLKFDADSSGIDKVRAMLTGKGRKAIEGKLTGESRVVLDELAKPFDEAFAEATAQGKSASEAQKAGLEAFDKAMAATSKSTLKYKDVADEAADRLKNDPSTMLRQSIDRMNQAFSKPELVSAVDSLAKSLPKIASAAAKFLDFAGRNPGTTAAGLVGGKLALTFAGGALADAAKNFGSGAGKSLAAEGPSIGKSIANGMRPPVPGGGGGGGAGGAGLPLAVAAAGAGALLAVDQASKLDRDLGIADSGQSVWNLLPGMKKGEFDTDTLMKEMVASASFGFVGGQENMFGSKLGKGLADVGHAVVTSDERANAAAVARTLGTDMDDMPKALAERRRGSRGEIEQSSEYGTRQSEGTAGANVEKLGSKSESAATALDGAAKAAKNLQESMLAAARAVPGGTTKGPKPIGNVPPGSTPRPG